MTTKLHQLRQNFTDENGDYYEGQCLALLPAPKAPYNFTAKEWTAVALNAFRLLARLASTGDISKTSRMVLDAIMGHIGYGNELRLPQKQIARELNIDTAEVSRAFKQLRELGLIEPAGKVGTVTLWRVNPLHCWRGSPKSHAEALGRKRPANDADVRPRA